MNRTLMLIALIVGLIVAVLLATVAPYNRLVRLEEAVDSGWSQVENVYQRRSDLIPNLVATVQGAADFERQTLQAVVDARAKATQISFENAPSAAELAAFEAAQGELSQALSRLLLVVEAYPQIQATQNFRDLQAQLEGTENRITVERQRFTEKAQEYNTARRQFPTNIVASLTGFEEKAYFRAEAGADQPPPVDFSFSDDG
jgi:LemA protein